jgi:hypothetical protein
VLLWDGLSAHWSTRMRAWLDSKHDWLRVERIPAYAPELNPVEYLWANLKDLELANLPTVTLGEVGVPPISRRVGYLAPVGDARLPEAMLV